MDAALVFLQLSAIIQAIFTFFAALDAVWFHFYKHKLHVWSATRKEHWLHTANACLFPVTLWCLFVFPSGGLVLWAGIFITLLTFGIEFVDVGHEKTSRVGFGGLSSVEGVMHFGMGVARAAAFALLVSSKPLEAFSLQSPWVLSTPFPEWVMWQGRLMFAASLPMALLHVAFCFSRPRPLPEVPSVRPLQSH